MHQNGSEEPYYESPEYAVRKGERQVLLEVNPPLLLRGDVKVEFSSKLKLLDNLQGLARRSQEFHFHFNTFFVDSPFSSDLSYSVTSAATAASTSSANCSLEEEDEEEEDQGSQHEALVMKGSLDSSDSEKLPAANGAGLRRSRPAPERHTSCVGGVAKAAAEAGADEDVVSLTNLIKHASVSDEYLLQQEHSRAPEAKAPGRHLQQQLSHPPQQQNMVTSTSSSSSSSSASATLLSFNEMRKRHTSVPQSRLNPASAAIASRHSSAIFDHRQRVVVTEPRTPSLTDLPPGTPVGMRLDKWQVDKAFKDKQCKVYPDNFAVHLFLLRPDDQVSLLCLSEFKLTI